MFIDSQLRLPPNGDGGPLVDAKGRVVGINTPNIHRPDHIEGAPGESHALPIRVVTGFLKMAKAFPTAEQSWLGLAFRPLSPGEKRAAHQILGQSAGVFVDYVWRDGPAGQTEIASGDILVSLNGNKIEHLHELDRLLLDLPPGEPAELALLRADRVVFQRVAVERRPPWAGHVNWRLPQAAASADQGSQASLGPK
jgi:serine protease Do